MTGPDEASAPAYPRATYRLQLNKDFRFDDARHIVPYLARLGVSHLYLSPILMARPGSAHGYDIVDHNRLNPELGDEAAFDALAAEARRHGMGIIVDFVPNHMFLGQDNAWWMDILEWGTGSPYASFVDIDWEPQEPTNAGKVVLPVLGDHYGAVLERGELALRFDVSRGAFVVDYFDKLFPISPRHLPELLGAAAARAPDAEPRLRPLMARLADCLSLRGSRARRTQRHERVDAIKAELAALAAEDAGILGACEAVGRDFCGAPGDPASFDALHRLLERQSYRLAFWRVAAHEINYRRFFDINELVGLRMEEPELFRISHRLIGRLIAEGKIHGLRLDHIDGLRLPERYLARLQELAGGATGGARPLYTVVEKILLPGERLRETWAVDGTTGYDFMAEVNGLFVDPAGERPLSRGYDAFLGRSVDYDDIVGQAKRLIVRRTLASELNVLANAFNRIAKRSRATRDYTLTAFREALEDVVAAFPVYRTYVTENGASAEDRNIITFAAERARREARMADSSIYDFIARVLTVSDPAAGGILRGGGALRQAVAEAALKFQQFTGAVMAKSVEDTAFYRYLRLVSLNEVGGEPARFALPPEAFHAAAGARHLNHPLAMVATATHDHKRGEDVRARLNVLSEMPAEWGRRAGRWARLNRRWKITVADSPAPTANDEYLLYQTMVGAWPLADAGAPPSVPPVLHDRLQAYMLKAVREAKLRTSWAAPDAAYEKALADFITALCDARSSDAFIADLAGFVATIAPAGAIYGLAQTTLKLTVPGVPDIYQGTERWDLSLVDPDNRGPVDYALREALAGDPDAADHRELCRNWHDGAVKQHVIARILAFRCAHPQIFARGSYRPCPAAGPAGRRVFAFARHHAEGEMVVAVQRLIAGHVAESGAAGARLSTVGWNDSSLTLGAAWRDCVFHDVISGRTRHAGPDGSLPLAELFADLPVAVLHRRGADIA